MALLYLFFSKIANLILLYHSRIFTLLRLRLQNMNMADSNELQTRRRSTIDDSPSIPLRMSVDPHMR